MLRPLLCFVPRRYHPGHLWKALGWHFKMKPGELVEKMLQLSKHSGIDRPSRVLPPLATLTNNLDSLDGSQLCKLFVACKGLRVDDDFWRSLCDQSTRYKEFRARDISTILNCLTHPVMVGKSVANVADAMESRLIKRMCALAVPRAPEFSDWDISVTLNALGKFGVQDEVLIKALCSGALSKTFTPQGTGLVLNALVKLGKKDVVLIRKLCSEALPKTDFSPQDIANTLHALAKFDFHDRALVKKLCYEALVSDFKEQEIVNTLSALASFNLYDEALLKKLCTEALSYVGVFNEQHISTTLSVLAKFRFLDMVLVKKLCLSARSKVDAFNAQGIANILNALDQFELYDEVLMKQLCSAALKKVSDFKPQGIAYTLGVLAKFGLYEEVLVTRLCSEALTKVPDFSSKQVAQTLKALAKFNLYDEVLINKLSAEATLKASDLHSQSIADILSALAKFDVYDEALVKRLCSEALPKVIEFTAEGIATMLYSLMVLQHFDHPLLESLGVSLLRFPGESLSPEAQDQLALSKLWLTLHGVTLQLPRDIRSKPNAPAPISAVQQEVSDVLTAIGVEHANQYDIGGLLVDNALVDRRVVVEVAEPSHFCRGSEKMLGTTLFRHRLLRRLGWEVLGVQTNWDKLSNVQRENFLKALLKKIT